MGRWGDSQSAYLVRHLVLHILLLGALAGEGDDQLGQSSLLHKVPQLILVDEVLGSRRFSQGI